MRKINKQEYEMCKKHGLLYDGKNLYDGIDKSVAGRAQYKNGAFGRNYIRVRNSHVYVTEGRNGIYDSIQYFMKKELINNES
jgi:hypothetical protein